MSLFGTHSTRLYVASPQGELCKYSHVSHTFVYKVCAAANSSNRICFPFLTIKPNVDLAWKSSSRSFQYSNRTFYCSSPFGLLWNCLGFALDLPCDRSGIASNDFVQSKQARNPVDSHTSMPQSSKGVQLSPNSLLDNALELINFSNILIN